MALNNKFDYQKNKTSKSCILKNYYNEYQDIASYSGPLVDGSAIKILDEDGNVILNMSPFKISEMFEDDDDFWGGSDEFHSWNNYDVSGYFIKWRLDGSGVYFRGEFHDDEFSIKKLKISILILTTIELSMAFFIIRNQCLITVASGHTTQKISS